MKVFVTGACGFIGSNLIEYLFKKNIKVVAYTYYNSHNSIGLLKYCDKKIINKIKIISGDIRDFKRTKSAMKGCDSVIHLAALIGIPYSYHSPESYIETNVNGTYNVLESSKDLGLKKIILTSTSEVYGSAKYTPIDENHPLNPQSPYAATKISADSLGLSFYYSYNLPITILRPFNTFGPKQSMRAVIPTIISQYLKNKNNIKIGNTHTIRDLTYVEDTSRAFYIALKSKKNNILVETINLGTSYGIKISEILKIIEKEKRTKLNIIKDEIRVRSKNSEVLKLISNNKKAQKLLGWKPILSGKNDFKKGLMKTLQWYQKNSFSYDVSKYII